MLQTQTQSQGKRARGQRAGKGTHSKPELQLSGLLHLMQMLANTEVRVVTLCVAHCTLLAASAPRCSTSAGSTATQADKLPACPRSTCHCKALWVTDQRCARPNSSPCAAESRLKASEEPLLLLSPCSGHAAAERNHHCCTGPRLLPGLLKEALLLQDGEEREDSERRRLSSAGLRGEEQPLPPRMVSFIVDALQDRWGPRLVMLDSGCVGSGTRF